MTSPEGFIVVALTSFPDKWEFDLNPKEKPLMQVARSLTLSKQQDEEYTDWFLDLCKYVWNNTK